MRTNFTRGTSGQESEIIDSYVIDHRVKQDDSDV